jgi:undecaprenyl-diphosphatase
MTVLIVFVLAGASAALVSAVVFAAFHRNPAVAHYGPVHATARALEREIVTHRGVARFLRERVNPRAATGLALTVALLLLVTVGVLAFEVRRQSFVARADLHVARWAAEHATAVSTRVLKYFTNLGSTVVIAVITAVVAFVEARRTRAAGVVVFLAVTVIGANLATNLVKVIVERARPDVDRLVAASGFSFPSGHSSAAAACFAACALCLGRGRTTRTRLVLSVVAAALAVMVATSRVLLGVHWTSDAFAGLCFGAAWFLVCAVAFGGRLLRFGAPVEAAVRVDAATTVEVSKRGRGETHTQHEAHRPEDEPGEDVGEEVHPELHP